MAAKTLSEIHRDLTQTEIDVRTRVWAIAISSGEPGEEFTFTQSEIAALWSSILQTGRELSWYREQIPVATGTVAR